jgi:hypothetical protein
MSAPVRRYLDALRLMPIDFTSGGQLPAEAYGLRSEIGACQDAGLVKYRRSQWSHEPTRKLGLELTPAGRALVEFDAEVRSRREKGDRMSAPAGPYTVEHRRPVAPDEDGSPFCAACSHYHDGSCLCPDCGRPTPCRDHGQDRSVSTPATTVVSRWAYATLEEARAKARRIIGDAPGYFEAHDGWSTARLDANVLGGSGGMIQLPDGSEIVVEATTTAALWVAVSPSERRVVRRGKRDAVVLAAWNAEYGIGKGRDDA